MPFPENIQKEIEIIVETIKKTVDCERIYLFGSYAYGEPSEDSDLDFYVVMPDGPTREIEVMRMIRLNLPSFGRTMPLDIIARHSSRFYNLRSLPTMERQIADEGILLYERA